MRCGTLLAKSFRTASRLTRGGREGDHRMSVSALDREQHREGTVARGIEQQTAKIPSDLFLWGAFGAIAASATLQFMGNRQVSTFVGQWAPTILILGLYNKMVKQLGSDRTENAL
jgi:hypothetical protein